MIFNLMPDIDSQETKEWLEALEVVIESDGLLRAQFLLNQLAERARSLGVSLNIDRTTPYINTIPAENEEHMPEDGKIFKQLLSLLRWNAVAMVLRAGKKDPSLGGHIATYASAAVLYEVGFNYFFRGRTEKFLGDLIYIQGHSSPGIYARAFLEGRLSEQQLENFKYNEEEIINYIGLIIKYSTSVDLQHLWHRETDRQRKREALVVLADLIAQHIKQ